MLSLHVSGTALAMAAALLAGAAVAAAEGTSTRPQPLPVELPIKPTAPELQLPDLSGRVHAIAEHRERWLLVHFWASWCGPCLEELPSLARAQRTLGANLKVLTVNLGESPVQVSELAQRLALSLPILLDQDSAAGGRWQIQGLPTSYLVTPDGRIFGGVIGSRTWDEPTLLQWMQQIIQPPQSRAMHQSARESS